MNPSITPTSITFPWLAKLQPFQRHALLAVLVIAVGTTCLIPFAQEKWPAIPAFLAIYQTAIIGAYAIVAYLLYGYFYQTRSLAALYLWSGSVYTAIILLAQFLSVPSLFVPNHRLLGQEQTTIWLWFFWHLGATGMLFAYALTELRGSGRLVINARAAFMKCAGLTTVGVFVSLLTVTTFILQLPVMDVAGDFNRITHTGYAPFIQSVILAALFMLWRATGFKEPVSAWIGVAMVALAFDNAITMAGGTRLSIGWYIGRINALLAALVMLVLYLKEINSVYLRARIELEASREHLESLVQARTRSLEETQAALMHAQKLEAIGKLTGGVAHDFNNVLHIINGSIDLIGMLTSGNERVHERCNAAQAAVQRGAKLAAQLLAFARKQPLQPSAVNLASVFADIDLLLKRAVGERIKIRFELSPATWNVEVDVQQLENVILNIAINASDAIFDTGTLRITMDNMQLDQEGSKVDYVRLVLADSGQGMSEEVRARAFEPFFSTKGVGKGTGLGLSMAYGFVKQSGGHIDIESVVGIGTTVTILLPRTVEEATVRKSEAPAQLIGGSEVVLVVDDEEEIRNNVAAILSQLGYQILTADCADSAVAILEQNRRIDLLFTDVIMPGAMSSTALAALARVRRPDIRILYTSGYTEEAVIHNGRLDHGVQLLSKPYARDDLAQALRGLLSH